MTDLVEKGKGMERQKGQCLCGAVRVSAEIPKREFMACHCTQCQRWTGGGPLFAVRAKDIAFDGTENIRTYHASEWGERASCKTCGTILYWTMQGKPPAFLALGLLDDREGMTLKDELFVDHRATWFPETPGAAQSTEAQQKAQLKAYLEKQT